MFSRLVLLTTILLSTPSFGVSICRKAFGDHNVITEITIQPVVTAISLTPSQFRRGYLNNVDQFELAAVLVHPSEAPARSVVRSYIRKDRIVIGDFHLMPTWYLGSSLRSGNEFAGIPISQVESVTVFHVDRPQTEPHFDLTDWYAQLRSWGDRGIFRFLISKFGPAPFRSNQSGLKQDSMGTFLRHDGMLRGLVDGQDYSRASTWEDSERFFRENR